MKLELKRPPPRISSEALPVGLPRPGQTLGTQVNIRHLVVAEDVKFDPAPSAGINGFAVGCEIECDLNKTAIVLDNLTSPRIRIAGRPATISRTMVPLDTPPMTRSVNSCHLGSDRRQRRIAAQIIDYGRIYLHGLTLHRAAHHRDGGCK